MFQVYTLYKLYGEFIYIVFALATLKRIKEFVKG